jgi:hypothetical protein
VSACLKGVLEIGEEARLVEELCRLKIAHASANTLLGARRHRLQELKRDILADDGGDLKKALLLGGETVDASRQDGMDGAGDLDVRQWCRQSIRAPLPDQRVRLHQCADALLEEEGIALGALDQERLQSREVVGAKQRLQELVGARGRQRIDPNLRVVCLAAPAVLVLRTIVGEEQDAGGGQTLEQAVEEGLGLAVDPVKILEHEAERLDLTLAEQQSLDRVERSLPALRWVQMRPLRLLDGEIQEREEGRQYRFERAVEHQNLAGHLFTARA